MLPPTNFVHALASIFEHTGGARWRERADWPYDPSTNASLSLLNQSGKLLSGDPCVDAWHGITCCPHGYRLRCADTRACQPRADILDLCDRLDEAPDVPGSLRVVPAVSRSNQQTCDAASEIELQVGGRLELCRRVLQGDQEGRGGDFPRLVTSTSLGEAICGVSDSLRAASNCSVVGIDLAGNELRGSLEDASLCELSNLTTLNLANNHRHNGALVGSLFDVSDPTCLPRLEYLDVHNNRIDGDIPKWLATAASAGRLRYLNLANVRFSYPATSQEREARLAPLVKACRAANCMGLPPLTCTAFRGDDELRYVPKTGGGGEECVACRNLIGPIALLGAFFLFGLMFMMLYVFLVQRYGKDFLTRWVSTVGIYLNHIQTVSIIGNLALDWPPAVIWITSTLSGNMLDLGFVRPECLFKDIEDVSPYFIFTIGSCLVMLAMLTACRIVKVLIEWFGPLCVDSKRVGGWVDTVEFVHTIVFSGQLTPTWHLAYAPTAPAAAALARSCKPP